MSEQDWTPEPWKIENWKVIGPESEAVAHTYGQTLKKNQRVISVAEQDANAARIVACVNACDGIENPQEEIPRLVAEVNRLRRGDFTEQEFQGLCHKFQDNDVDRFASGCVEYMNKLFGRCPLVMVNKKP